MLYAKEIGQVRYILNKYVYEDEEEIKCSYRCTRCSFCVVPKGIITTTTLEMRTLE